MFDDGFYSKLIKFAGNLDNNNKIKQIIVQLLSNKLIQNDANLCLIFINIKQTLLWNFMQTNPELYTNFLDSIFYFARHMKQIENHWISNYEFKYEHLVKIVEILLHGPTEISDIIYNRMKLVKTHPNGTIWQKIEKDIGW